jgi:hypothetical protein
VILSAMFAFIQIIIDTDRLPDVHFVAAGSSLAGAGVAVVLGAAPAIGVGHTFDEFDVLGTLEFCKYRVSRRTKATGE